MYIPQLGEVDSVYCYYIIRTSSVPAQRDLHFLDMLNNLCIIFHKIPFIS